MRNSRSGQSVLGRALDGVASRMGGLGIESRLRVVVVLTATSALLCVAVFLAAGELLLGEGSGPGGSREESAWRVAWFAGAAGLSLLLATGLGFAVAARIQGALSEPILRLLDAVRRVSSDRTHMGRPEGDGRDEISLLVDAFNDMIQRVERSDAAREAARGELIRQARDLARSNAELDDFAYVASHDLKEPLRGIRNYARFLLEDYGDVVDAEGVKKLETLIRLGDRLEKLIETLLHYARLGRTEQSFGPTDLDAVLHEVLDTFGPSFETAEVEVRIPRPLPTVFCDSARVGEVFRNLIGNAFKYNDGTQRWIEIQWSCDAEPAEGAYVSLPGSGTGDHPVFSVRDNGIGIREKQLPSIFRIFKRLHGRDRYGGGTGAGLGIVKKIVERHGGRLWVESRRGEGTAFYFSVGALQVEEPGKEA